MAVNKTILNIVEEIRNVFRPLVAVASYQPPFGLVQYLRGIGLDLADSDWSQLEQISSNLLEAYAQVEQILEDGTLDISDMDNVFVLTSNLHQSLSGFADLPFQRSSGIEISNIPALIVNDLTVQYLFEERKEVFSFLKLIGAIDDQNNQRSINLGAISRFINTPLNEIARYYRWDTNEFRPYYALSNLQEFLEHVNIDGYFSEPSLFQLNFMSFPEGVEEVDRSLKIPIFKYLNRNQLVEAGPIIIPKTVDFNESYLGLFLYGTGNLGAQIALSDRLSFGFKSNIESTDDFGIEITPSGANVSAVDGVTDLRTKTVFTLSYTLPRPENIELFNLLGSSLTIGGGAIDFFIETKNGELGFGFDFHAYDSTLNFDPSELDGLIRNLLPFGNNPITLDLSLGFSSLNGLRLNGRPSFSFSIPSHINLGLIRIPNIHIDFSPEIEAPELDLGFDIEGALGPFSLSIQNVGIYIQFGFGGEGPKSLGLFDLDIGIKSPSGLGVSINTSIISGGGFLDFNAEKGQYAGIFSLDIFSIGVNVMGVLDTKDPSGQPLPSPGFSFLIIILSDLPKLQIGFGFTLNGVGGLLGVNRTTDTEALQTGMRAGALDSIMFPEDPLRNMNRIITDIRSIFPVQMSQYVFGPMFQLGWGTPNIFEVELGVIVDLPEPVRIILLGQLRSVLPSKDLRILQINVDLLGILDFGAELLYIEAGIRNSKLMNKNLNGQMAFMLQWGNTSNFILSIGGFHPDYPHAGNVPALDKLGLSMGSGDALSLSLDGFFAVTSNSLQFGGEFKVYLGVDAAHIEGFLSFETLIIFSPFYFRFDFAVELSVRVAGKNLAGIQFTGILEGPSPFRIKGKGCISILFLDLCLEFDFTIGGGNEEELPPPVKDPWRELEAAIMDPGNWGTESGPYSNTGVQLSTSHVPPDVLMVHPLGGLTFLQNIVPLKRIEKYGEFSVGENEDFSIEEILVSGEAIADLDWKYTKEPFVPGNYEELSYDEKLSRVPFQEMNAGLIINQGSTDFGSVSRKREINHYETVIIDSPDESRINEFVSLDSLEDQLIDHQLLNETPLISNNPRRQLKDVPEEQLFRID